ncbi:polyhydroxyalkanoate synthesis regulator phasin [Bradyrhizobium sp. USDA 377]
MTKINNIDAIMSKARSEVSGIIAQSEEKFIVDTVERGALTVDEAQAVLQDNREAVQDAFEEIMTRLREWIDRGATDLH